MNTRSHRFAILPLLFLIALSGCAFFGSPLILVSTPKAQEEESFMCDKPSGDFNSGRGSAQSGRAG